MKPTKKMLIAATLNAALLSTVSIVQAAPVSFTTSYSPTISYGNTITNGSTFSRYIDLSSYLPSGAGISNVINSISVKANYADDASDSYSSSTVEMTSTTGTAINYPWVLGPARYIKEENHGYSGGQLLFVDIWARDFLTTRTFESESATIQLQLPNGATYTAGGATSMWSNGISKTGETPWVSYFTGAGEHYSCAALHLHWCGDSLHDYVSATQRWDYLREVNSSAGWSNNISNLDTSGLSGNQGFWFTVNGTGGDLQLSSMQVMFDATTTTVPVPAAAWLLGSGLLGLAGVARRKVA